ncbi:MAG TPA: hypothetical protein DIU00_00595 [Phycisphaerales bacterium]|nr:hypothetical protein [Phycisphaerales bacterium]
MSRITLFLILVFFVSVVAAASEFDTEIIDETPLLRDGFVMMGVDGTLVGPDSNDVYFFELLSDVNDYRVVLKAGTKLELLPSSALEKMIAGVKKRPAAIYRLWNGRVTRYRGRNFIFPNYFLPMMKAEKPEPKTSQQPQQEREQKLALDEPNDVLAMPPEVIEKLRAARDKTSASVQPITDVNEISVDKSQPAAEEGKLPSARSYAQSADSVFVDRTAFLVERDDGRLVFVPDALGRNVQKLSLHLLPCAVLEMTEQKQAAEPEPVRFKIAGIMTKYKGDNYLLLERAIRTYSHGNFGR